MAKITVGGRSYDVEVRGESVIVDGHEFPVTVRDDGAHRTVNAGGIAYRVQLPAEGARTSGMEVQVDYRPFKVEYEGSLSGAPAPRPQRSVGATGAAPAPRSAVKGGVAAPIAGKVLRVSVAVGASVNAGDVLLVLEAMKMENEIKAPVAGTVKEILVAEGARVSEGETLAIVE